MWRQGKRHFVPVCWRDASRARGAASAGIVVALLSAFACSGDEGARPPDAGEGEVPPVTRPAEWPEPDESVVVATSQYLSEGGEGGVVLVVVDEAVALAEGDHDEAACDAVAGRLDAAIDQDGYRAVAAGIPDATLAELALSLATVMSDALAACLDGEGDLDVAFEQLGQINDAVALRQEELG